jgi:glycosyltransferase involved in cell wall biosynthesis
MRIAFISFIKDPWGGSEELWAAAAEQALRDGHEVIISAVKLNVPAPKFEAFARKGARVQYRRGFINPAWSRNERIIRKIIIFLQNKLSNPFQKVFQARPDVVVFTGAAYSMVLNKPLFDGLISRGIPYVLNIQVNVEYGNPVNREEAAYLKKVYGLASASAFVSHRNLEVAERHLLTKIPHAKVLRNPVNLGTIQALPMPSLTGRTRLAIVANLLVNHKGQDLAFDVMRMPKWMSRDVDLHLYGGGYDEHFLKELAKFYGLGERVVFHGRISDIVSVWRDNHLLLLPSLNEGTPLALVEAMLCARPVITTDVGGNTEWVRDGVDGFIAGGANTMALDEAMERAWQQRNEWHRIGQNAFERAKSLYEPAPGAKFLEFILQHGQKHDS